MTSGTNDILGLLVAERDRLDQAIAVLQGGVDAPPRKRRGRPPGSRNKKVASTGKGPMSAAARKAASERMKKYWAQRRKQKAVKSSVDRHIDKRYSSL